MFRDTQVSNCWLTHVSPSYPHCIILCPHHTVSQFYHITSHNIPIIILCMMSYCIPRISRFYTITFPYPHNILLIIYIIKNIPIIEYPQNISIIMWYHITWSPTYPYNIPTISSHPQVAEKSGWWLRLCWAWLPPPQSRPRLQRRPELTWRIFIFQIVGAQYQQS